MVAPEYVFNISKNEHNSKARVMTASAVLFLKAIEGATET
jgi:hypothetical protein